MLAHPSQTPSLLPPYTEDFLTLEQLAHIPPEVRSYSKTYDYDGDYISPAHRELAHCPRDGARIQLSIPGALRAEDALKLYELAYFSPGHILEAGTATGLSASILARGCYDRACGSHGRLMPRIRELVWPPSPAIRTIDLHAPSSWRARRNLLGKPGARRVRFHVGDAAHVMDHLQERGMTFALAFVDHSHARTPVVDVCRRLGAALTPGGFALFHDYCDRRNADPDLPNYEVYQAVHESLKPSEFEFYGIFGCAALFRKVAGLPTAKQATHAPVAQAAAVRE